MNMDDRDKGALVVGGLILGCTALAELATPGINKSIGHIALHSVPYSLGLVAPVAGAYAVSKALHNRGHDMAAMAVVLTGLAVAPSSAKAASKLAHHLSATPHTAHTARSAFNDNKPVPAKTITYAAAQRLTA